MKKIIILFFAIVILMSGCASKNYSKDQYKYADSWKPMETTYGDYEPTEEFYSHATEIDNPIFLPIKEGLRQYYGGVDDFDWDNFDKVTTVQYVSVSDEEIFEISADFLYAMLSTYAVYNDETKVVYLFPAYVEEDSLELQAHVLVHELIHALTVTGHSNHTRLEEGLADHYTCLYMEAIGMIPQPVYVGEMLVIRWLSCVYGEQVVLDAVMDGTIESMIDEATKPGMAAKLDKALKEAFYTAEPEVINVEYDILAHLARSQGKTAEVKSLLRYAEVAYGSAGIPLDNDYLMGLLEGGA